MRRFPRHRGEISCHVLVGEHAGRGLRRRRRDEGPQPAAGGQSAAGGPVHDDELEIEKSWLLLAKTDSEEFGRFFAKYHRPLLAYIQHRTGDPDLAQDLLSETFLEAVRHLGTFRFRGVTFGAWLFRLARRRVARHYARRRRRKEVPFAVDEHDRPVEVDPAGAVEEDQDAQLLALCLRQLGDLDQDLVVLHYFGGLRLAQVAVVLGMSEGNVKTRLYRARQRLASLLDDPAIRGRLSREGRRALDELRLEPGRLSVVSGDRRAAPGGADDEDDGRRT